MSVHIASALAFEELGFSTCRVRPAELTRGGFDLVLESLKNGAFGVLWVDMNTPRIFAKSVKEFLHVCQRLRILLTTAARVDVPICLASSNSGVLNMQAFQDLISLVDLEVTHHNWCAFGIKASSCGASSSVVHRCASDWPLTDTPCACDPSVEHVNNLALREVTCTSYQRQKAEKDAIVGLICAAWSSNPKGPISGSRWTRPAKPADSVAVRKTEKPKAMPKAMFCSTYVECPSCNLYQPADEAFCLMCEVEVSTPDTPSVELQESLEPTVSFPTEQKIAAKERAKAGHVPTRRKKQIEQHFDDCGDDVTPLESAIEPPAHVAEFELEGYSSEEDDHELDVFLSRFTQWMSCSSEYEEPPDLPHGTLIACDVTEMFYILNSKSHEKYGVEIVELCGGRGHTSYLCIRRQMSAGHNFELVTGCDLTDSSTQTRVLSYLEVARPLVIVMGPTCGPFGPLGRWNRVINPQGWLESMSHAEPLASFCGKVALHQLKHDRHFLCEQPQSSELFRVEPWLSVVNNPQVLSVVFHQCRVKQYVNGLLCRKATELVSSAVELLKPFEGLVCTGDHPHASLVGGQAVKAQRWSHNMCERIAHGIERLAKRVKMSAYPTVGTDPAPPDPAADDESGELWRKCKGCRWRLPKEDPAHSRERGVCKHPNVTPHTFECPGCVAHRPRNHTSHTFGPDCRYSLSTPRTGVRKRPYSRVPAEEEPTSGLRGSDLGVEDERNVENQLDRELDRIEPPPPPEGEPVGDAAAPPAADEPASASSGRGPDIVPRVRRTFREGEAQTPVADDWTSFDVSSALRGLRHSDEAGRRRILRKLHLRWWHASAERMRRMLITANIDKETLDLIPGIVDTCRVCRLWSKPGTDSIPSNRLVTGFNVEVEGDLVFYRHHGSQQVILHLVDRGVRWASAWVIPDKTTQSILTGLDQRIGTFGPMQVLIFDGELGLDDDQSTQYFELKGITKRTAAVGQHVRICDRRTQVLRDTLHKIATQLSEEGLVVPLQRILAEAVFALNALTSVNGCSPYTAVLGRIPPILPEALAVPDDSVSDPTTAHVHRLREIAIQAIVEGTARERMKRALHTPTRVAHQELEFKVGETVEYWRQPENREASGWRGPATVCDLSRLEHGRIGIRTRADNVLTCRIQDVRRCLAYAVDIVSPETSSGGVAQHHIQHHIENMTKGVVLVLGSVKAINGSWTNTASTTKHFATFEASLCLASVVFQLSNTAAVRLGYGVRNLPAKSEFVTSTLLFWTEAYSKAIEYQHSEQTSVNFVGLVGQEWTKVRFIQFLQVTEEDEFLIKPPEDDVMSNSSSGNATAQDTGRAMSIGGPLSTIPEGTSEGNDSNLVTWEELQVMFGIGPSEENAQLFAQALVAIESETSPTQPPDEVNNFLSTTTNTSRRSV